MKNKYMLTISAFSIIAGSMLSQQTLQARSETATGMEKGAAQGEVSAGPVGAVFGGLFGGTVGLAKDTGNVVTGRTTEEREMQEPKDEEISVAYDESEMTEPESKTATEMEKGAASGEEVAGPLGALAGGIVGAGVGLVEDTGDFVTGNTAEQNEMQRPQEEEDIFMTYEVPDEYDRDLNMIPRDVSNMDNPLTIDEVE